MNYPLENSPTVDWANLRPRMVRGALGITKKPEDAEDAVQDALVAMCRALNSETGLQHPVSVAYRATRSKAFNVLRGEIRRSRKVARYKEAHGAGEEEIALAEDPNDEEQTARVIQSALDTLDPQFAELIRLHFFEGMTKVDLAAKLGVVHSTITKRMGRALRQLKIALEEKL
jgi:RNA polymerase sigma-70 factor (ECF subfamily)